MKFTPKWFVGQCEICSAKGVHVRYLQKYNLFPCEGCMASKGEWFLGKCEGRECGREGSVRWVPDANAHLCINHRDAQYEMARYGA